VLLFSQTSIQREYISPTTPLEGSRLEISADFRHDFEHNARRDSKGHGLKDFDLSTRLFRNRLSYVIYAQAFEEAPDGMRAIVYEKLHAILAAPELQRASHIPTRASAHASSRSFGRPGMTCPKPGMPVQLGRNTRSARGRRSRIIRHRTTLHQILELIRSSVISPPEQVFYRPPREHRSVTNYFIAHLNLKCRCI